MPVLDVPPRSPSRPPASSPLLAVIASAATVTHRTTNHGQRLPVQSRNGSSDLAPVDVNFAAYPEGSTPPPDDRGLIPAAVFKFQTAKV